MATPGRRTNLSVDAPAIEGWIGRHFPVEGVDRFDHSFFGFTPYEAKIMEPQHRGEAVTTTSPQFATVYNQAAAAEAYRLSDVAGPGFRKALEFLIKDHANRPTPGRRRMDSQVAVEVASPFSVGLEQKTRQTKRGNTSYELRCYSFGTLAAR